MSHYSKASKDSVELARKRLSTLVETFEQSVRISRAMGLMPESPINVQFSTALGIALDAAEQALFGGEKHDEWFDWFIYENDCGRRRLSANPYEGAPDVTIDSVDSLIAFITLPPKRGKP